MGGSRRYWGEGSVVVMLVGFSVLFDRPLLLVGASGVAGWLVARQYAFVRTLSAVVADLSITQSPERDSVDVDETVPVVLDAELPHPTPIALTVDADPPVGVTTSGETSDGRRVSLPIGDRAARTTFSVSCPLAGGFQFGPPTVTATDETGRFSATFALGPEPRLTVTPRSPGNVHVGTGGESLEAPYGDAGGNTRGSGLDFAELRAYVPGDEMRQIDWNATARLGEAHVREYEATTEHKTVLLVDCRPSMAAGPDGETKFDYAREVALTVVGHAREQGDSIGVYAVGDEGLLSDHPPAASEEWYATLERRLRALEPQRPEESSGDDRRGDGGGSTVTQSPAMARRRSDRLRTDDSTFGDRLKPFFTDVDPYVERVAHDPLYGVARTHLKRLRGAVTTVVLTDDARPTETRQVAKIARRYNDHVLAFLTPSSLFDGDVTDLEVAYDRYADFERYRRDLAGLDGVSAFEVGPGDRLDALLAADSTHRWQGTGD